MTRHIIFCFLFAVGTVLPSVVHAVSVCGTDGKILTGTAEDFAHCVWQKDDEAKAVTDRLQTCLVLSRLQEVDLQALLMAVVMAAELRQEGYIEPSNTFTLVSGVFYTNLLQLEAKMFENKCRELLGK